MEHDSSFPEETEDDSMSDPPHTSGTIRKSLSRRASSPTFDYIPKKSLSLSEKTLVEKNREEDQVSTFFANWSTLQKGKTFFESQG